jgi:hypothetical protein
MDAQTGKGAMLRKISRVHQGRMISVWTKFHRPFQRLSARPISKRSGVLNAIMIDRVGKGRVAFYDPVRTYAAFKVWVPLKRALACNIERSLSQ